MKSLKILLPLLIAGFLAWGLARKECLFTPVRDLAITRSEPLETAPAGLNSPRITDLKDAFPCLVRQTRREIRIAGLYFTSNMNPCIVRELMKALKRGVKIFFLFADSDFSRREFFSLPFQKSANTFVRFADIAGLGRSPYGELHSKYAVFDQRAAVLGSANFSYPAFNDNLEANALVTEPEVIRGMKEIFDSDWAYASGTTDTLKAPSSFRSVPPDLIRPLFLLQSGPEELLRPGIPLIRDGIEALVRHARKGIDLEVYNITSSRTSFPFYHDLLETARQRKVAVRVLINQNTFDEKDDEGRFKNRYFRDSVRDLLKLGIRVKKINLAPLTKTAYSYDHSKLLLVDGAYAMLGSNNWSKSATYENRELAVITSRTEIVYPLKARFDASWDHTVSIAAGAL